MHRPRHPISHPISMPAPSQSPPPHPCAQERSLAGLRRKAAADASLHRSESLRLMGENVSLIKEVNELRREVKVGLLQQGTPLA